MGPQTLFCSTRTCGDAPSSALQLVCASSSVQSQRTCVRTDGTSTLSPEWVRACRIMPPLCVKLVPHTGGHSPVCVIPCLLKCVNRCLQMAHLCAVLQCGRLDAWLADLHCEGLAAGAADKGPLPRASPFVLDYAVPSVAGVRAVAAPVPAAPGASTSYLPRGSSKKRRGCCSPSTERSLLPPRRAATLFRLVYSFDLSVVLWVASTLARVFPTGHPCAPLLHCQSLGS